MARRIMPVLSATSAFSYLRSSARQLALRARRVEEERKGTHPVNAAKMVSSFALKCSTVGHLEPI